MATHATTRGRRRDHWVRVLTRPVVAVAVVLVVYGLLALGNAHQIGYLSTDTGGKVATLEAMARQDGPTLDVGYWAETWDPDGTLHPMWFTSHVGDEWVQVTTVPMVLVAAPLYDLGGYRLTLMVPMVGAVVAALGARALVRRTVADAQRAEGYGWLAFWLVALASPLTIYALDLWEHTWGAALVVWAAVVAVTVPVPGRPQRGLLIGLLVGAAATMRTESLVYGLVLTVAVVWPTVRAGRLLRATTTAAMVGLGTAVAFSAGTLLEVALLGEPIRAGRASGAASAGGSELTRRVEEALVTGLAPVARLDGTTIVLGIALMGLIALVYRRRHDPGLVRLGLAGIVAVYVLRAADGLGFVPGMAVAAPLAALALVAGPPADRRRLPWVVAVAAMPLVWAFQYTGGALPQWGARYLLPGTVVLVALGAVEVGRLPRPAARVLIGISVAVTVFGLAWVHLRTTSFESALTDLAERPEPVLVWEPAFLAREAGPLNLDEQWLTATDERARARAGQVVRDAGWNRFGLVQVADEGSVPPQRSIPGFFPVDRQLRTLVDGVDLWVTTYQAG